jgi:hypothetical protein
LDADVVNGLRVADEPLSDEKRKEFLETFRYNVGYRTTNVAAWAAATKVTAAPAKAMVAGERVRFGGEHAREALELLEQVGKQGGKTVNLSISSNSQISPADVVAVGGTVNRFADGYYAVLDRAQWDTLNEMKPPDASDLAPVQWSNFFVGNDAVMPNDVEVLLSRTDEDGDNVFALGGEEITLNPNQFLLIANEKGTSVLGAGQAVRWDESRPEEKIPERGFTLRIPRVGRAHLFEKLLLRAGERPQVRIEY